MHTLQLIYQSLATPSMFISLLVMLVPTIFILAAIAIKCCTSTQQTWPISCLAVWLVFGIAISVGISYTFLSSDYLVEANRFIRINSLSLIMLLLISIVALVIMQFSKHYLCHEPKENEYQFWLLFTLANVALVITSNHFLIFLFAWIMISVGLHQLLMFYPERPRAAMAAHKKFLISRVADICMITSIALLYHLHDSFYISEVLSHYQISNATSTQAFNSISQWAAVLFAMAALLKCAQLPLHGWLMQVMEAPTPVSALLHAGIINMGGFLMILLSPLISQSSYAQWLLLVFGGITAVLASLIMMTRISIKVMLAWSTCAQMGFMLVECGLGLYALALLHLVAHSFYKAYAFLNAGDAVQQYVQEGLAKTYATPSFMKWLASCLISVLLVSGIFYVTKTFENNIYYFLTLGTIMSIALTILFSNSLFSPLKIGFITLMAVSVTLLYAGWHALFNKLLPMNEVLTPLDQVMTIWVMLLFITLFLGYIALRYYPHSKLGKWLYLYLYAGLYLDEWFTRFTLKTWPAKLPARL